MIALAYYLLKVILCSGLLFLYYVSALKNKAFHQWNRFYLLSAVVLSLLLPLVKFAVFDAGTKGPEAIKILYAVQSADDYLETITVSANPAGLSPEQWMLTAYAFVCLVFLSFFIRALWRIRRLIKSHTVQTINNIRFLNTREPGTPFSFWRYIFWNEDIPLHSDAGRQIFQHEAVHVREGHTWDKLFLQTVLVVFWCNPFFRLIRRELRLLHEFIADQKAVGRNGTEALAAMILQAAYPQQYQAIVNPFFQTSIKRRLLMLTKIQNPRLNYISRIAALPLIALVAFAFTVRTKAKPKSVKLDKEFVVVIDAGHGKKAGHFTGAKGGDIYEDELALALAKRIREANTNANLKIVFTRTDDNLVELKDRMTIAQNEKADLFLSIHLNAVPDADKAGQEPAPKDQVEGMQIYIPADNSSFAPQSKALGSSLLFQLSSLYTTNPTLRTSRTSIYVLKAAPCPAVLIECGTINNKTDRDFITAPANQEKFAQRILEAVQQYAASKEKGMGFVADTIPVAKKQIESVDVNSAKKMLTVYYTDGTCETMTEKEAAARRLVNNDGYGNVQKMTPQDIEAKAAVRFKNLSVKPLIVIDGEVVSESVMNAIDPNKIEAIQVLKGDAAAAEYGDSGKNGVIKISTKKIKSSEGIILRADSMTFHLDSVDVHWKPEGLEGSVIIRDARTNDQQPIFERTEIEASVKTSEWRKFLTEKLTPVVNELSKTASAGTYTVNLRFIVGKDGSLSGIKALNDPGYGIAEKVAGIMQYSPKWTPAEQNGKIVKSYHTQPIRLVVSKN